MFGFFVWFFFLFENEVWTAGECAALRVFISRYSQKDNETEPDGGCVKPAVTIWDSLYFICFLFPVQLLRRQPAVAQSLQWRQSWRRALTARWRRNARKRQKMAKQCPLGPSPEFAGDLEQVKPVVQVSEKLSTGTGAIAAAAGQGRVLGLCV